MSSVENKIIVISLSDDVDRLKFLKAALTTDSERQALQYIWLDPETENAYASDGFRLHLCIIPHCLEEYIGKLVRFINPIKRGLAIAEIVEPCRNPNDPGYTNLFQVPDYTSVVERTAKQPPFYEIAFQSNLLQSSLKNCPDQFPVITFFADNEPYRIHSTGSEYQAIIMTSDLSAAKAHNKSLSDISKLQRGYEEEKSQRRALEARDLEIRLKKFGGDPEFGNDTLDLLKRLRDLRADVVSLENKAQDRASAAKVAGHE